MEGTTANWTTINNGSAGDAVAGTKSRRPRTGKKKIGYEPFKMRDQYNATTASGALLHLIKSSLGSGILAMPNAFKNGGLIFGLFGTAAIGALCTHCIYLLVLCSQKLARRTRNPALGFADTAAAAFTTGPRRFRAWAPFAREFVNAALFCTYYFGNCVYVILISASFKQVADNHTLPEWQFSIRTWILGLAFPLLPLGIIRTLRLLVPFSAIATTFILVGLGCSMAWVVTGVSPFASKEAMAAAVVLPDVSSRPWIAPVTHMPLFFATVIFAMEGIGTVLPIENSMRYPQHFLTGRPCGVLNAAMTLVVFLYSMAGFLGYLRFGDTTEGSITLNLPNDLFAEAVKIMVALSILFSYGLQFCVPSEIAWKRLEPWLRRRAREAKYPPAAANNKEAAAALGLSTIAGSVTAAAASMAGSATLDSKKQLELERERQENPMDGAYYLMRASMILGTFVIAAIVPNLAPIISLFGAIFFSMLGLFCPAIIHLVAFWESGDEDGDDYEDSSSEDDYELDGDSYVVVDGLDLEIGGGNLHQQHQQQHCNGWTSGKPTAARKKGMSRWTAAKDVCIALLALIALVSGAYASLGDIIEFYGIGEKEIYANVTANVPSAAT